ncbi:hypothetical protein HDU96_001275 [Phlyctochytrium bullatum]|nr:hypothetical protein HDU96_001275 [Phlyctochytrium bullatum]
MEVEHQQQPPQRPPSATSSITEASSGTMPFVIERRPRTAAPAAAAPVAPPAAPVAPAPVVETPVASEPEPAAAPASVETPLEAPPAPAVFISEPVTAVADAVTAPVVETLPEATPAPIIVASEPMEVSEPASDAPVPVVETPAEVAAALVELELAPAPEPVIETPLTSAAAPVAVALEPVVETPREVTTAPVEPEPAPAPAVETPVTVVVAPAVVVLEPVVEAPIEATAEPVAASTPVVEAPLETSTSPVEPEPAPEPVVETSREAPAAVSPEPQAATEPATAAPVPVVETPVDTVSAEQEPAPAPVVETLPDVATAPIVTPEPEASKDPAPAAAAIPDSTPLPPPLDVSDSGLGRTAPVAPAHVTAAAPSSSPVSIVPPVSPRSSKPFVRDRSEAAVVVFYASAVLLLYCWRFGSISQSVFAAVACLGTAPNRLAARLYSLVLEWPGHCVSEYKPLPLATQKLLVRPLSWFFPVKGQGRASVDSTPRVAFVANQHVVGVDVPLLITHIANETGLNVRTLCSPYHFRIPLWKHLLELLGCVPELPEVVQLLMDRGAPLLIYSDLNANGSNAELLFDAIKHNYTLVPVSTVGFSDAVSAFSSYRLLRPTQSNPPFPDAIQQFKVLATLPEKPVLDYLHLDTPLPPRTTSPLPTSSSTRTTTPSPLPDPIPEDAEAPPKSPPPKHFERTIPVVAPFLSPQACYVRFGEPLALPHVAPAAEDARGPAAADAVAVVEEAIREGIRACRDAQKADPERFVTPAGSLLVRRRRRSSALRRMKSMKSL